MTLQLKSRTKCNGTWIFSIEDFSEYNDVDQRLVSPPFTLINDSWQLIFYPSGRTGSHGMYLCLFLHCLTSEKSGDDEFEWKFSIVSENATKILHERSGTGFSRLNGIEIWNYFKRSDLYASKQLYLPNDVLTISCEITKSDALSKKRYMFLVPESRHVENLESLFREFGVGDIITLRVCSKGQDNESPTFEEKPLIESFISSMTPEFQEIKNVTDEIVKIDFQIYKGILTRQSPVFQAMFQHQETTESQQNVIEIEDMDADVCKEMIDFFYTDKLPVSKKNTMELLAVADKYQLVRLKALCEEAIFNTLTPENSLSTLINSDLHNAQQLKKTTIDYIVDHLYEISELDDYKLFKENYFFLAFEILEKYFIKTKNNRSFSFR